MTPLRSKMATSDSVLSLRSQNLNLLYLPTRRYRPVTSCRTSEGPCESPRSLFRSRVSSFSGICLRGYLLPTTSSYLIPPTCLSHNHGVRVQSFLRGGRARSVRGACERGLSSSRKEGAAPPVLSASALAASALERQEGGHSRSLRIEPGA